MDKCIVCDEYCITLDNHHNYDYCCIDLPPRYISERIDKWVCFMCIERLSDNPYSFQSGDNEEIKERIRIKKNTIKLQKQTIKIIKNVKCANCGSIIGYTSNLSGYYAIYCNDCKNWILGAGN